MFGVEKLRPTIVQSSNTTSSNEKEKIKEKESL
jgi:hypothetical protein